jgi:hypothetical protein
VLPKHDTKPDPAAGGHGRKSLNSKIMKAIYRNSLILVAALFTLSAVATKVITAGMLPIHVVFSAKAYWDGPSKSCIPREKGGCCHIWMDGMEPGPGDIPGEMTMSRGNSLQLAVSRGKGMNNESWRKYIADGKFILDGPITFDPEVLSRLGAEKGVVVPAGSYPVTSNGDQLIITFQLSGREQAPW